MLKEARLPELGRNLKRYDSHSRRMREDPRIVPILEQWKPREKNRDRSKNLPGKKRNADNASVDLPKMFSIQLG
jgi:hypothetical protein